MERLVALRARRVLAALSQRELAERAGMTQATIARLEAGRPARPTTTRKLAKALRVRPSDLMGWVGAEEGPGQ
jgi:transcriptional regulator with XRE-family HTH domain